MPQRWFLHTEEQLRNFNEHIRSQWVAGKRPTVQFVGEARSLEQNSMIHDLIAEIADQKGDETPSEIKRQIKLHIGVPILRANHPDFREKYDKTIKGLPYEQKLLAVDLLPVTSLMNKAEFAMLIDQTIQHFQEQGIELRPH